MNVCGTLKSFGPCVPLNSSGPCTYKLDGGGRGTDSFGHVSHSTQVALVHTNLTVVVEEQTMTFGKMIITVSVKVHWFTCYMHMIRIDPYTLYRAAMLIK